MNTMKDEQYERWTLWKMNIIQDEQCHVTHKKYRDVNTIEHCRYDELVPKVVSYKFDTNKCNSYFL